MEFDKLTSLPENARNEEWERRFLDAVIPMKVEVERGGEPVTGPDGWPYLSVRTGRGEEPFANIVRWLAGRGIGLVVNAYKMAPDYVFTYGMLWNFTETGRFITPWTGGSPGEVDLTGRLFGPPSEKYLPPFVRSTIKDFLNQQGLPNPRVVVATSADFKQTDLLFSSESMGAPNPLEQRTLAEALSWFLPLHYSLVFVPELSVRGWVEL